MTTHINITGTGLITALGSGVEANWRALMEGRFIRDHARVEVAHDLICGLGVSPEQSSAATAEQTITRAEHLRREPRVTQLAMAAAREALSSAVWETRDDTGLRPVRTPQQSGTALRGKHGALHGPKSHLTETALIIGTSKGPVETWMTAPPESSQHISTSPYDKIGRSGAIGLHEIGESLAHELQLGFGPRLTLSSACASGLHALIHAAMLLRSGVVKRALVVAAEASVHPLFISSFKRLGVLPPEGFGCRPFDQDRKGFLMSEAAAAVCLEAGDSDAGRGFARLDRFALGADATHLTGIDPVGNTLRRLLNQVIDNRPVDLVHAHGTGTAMNDPIELSAIEANLPLSNRPTWLYSHKGALGHSLGAAGLISIVLNAESHRRGAILPNVQTHNPIATQRVVLSRQAATTSVQRSLAIAAGFGGPVAVVSCVSL